MLDLHSEPSRETVTRGLRERGLPDDATPETMAMVDELRNPPAQPLVKRLGLLVVSLLLFISLGLLQWTVGDLFLLVIVIAVHESGHYLLMRAFGYRDVRMYFVPLFGAAVTASDSSPLGHQRALVALAGPVPGILLGVVLAFASLAGGSPMLARAAGMFLLLNAFNLLPVLPLDGGHVLYETLFCRNRWLEAVFQGIAAAGLIVLAFYASDWWLGVLGWLALVSMRVSFRLNGIVQRLCQDGAAAQLCSASDATVEFVSRVSIEVESAFPRPLSRAAMVNVLRSVIQKLRPQPPSASATVLLLGAYGVSILLAFVGAMLIVARYARDVVPPTAG